MSSSANPCTIEHSDVEGQKHEVESLCNELLQMSEKVLFKEKMKDILSCLLCCELRRCPMYQCKYGHLMCAGCLNNILSESQVQNEIASCPSCHTSIGLDICYRNVAVEKTIAELPVACPHCLKFFPPQNLNYHKSLCDCRPVQCSNAVIGCPWKGSFIEKDAHEKECLQLSFSGDKILESLTSIDILRKKEESLYSNLIDLLSVEKLSYSDIQLKKVENGSCAAETSVFSAFDRQWMLRVFCHLSFPDTVSSDVSSPVVHPDFSSIATQTELIAHKLILKTKPICSLSVKYVILPGPLCDMEIKPDVHHFKFTDEALETPQRIIDIPKDKDRESLLKSMRTNIRVVMFLA